ncbi:MULTISPECIES: TetR/AcrR family transcriptional regulator [Shimia]|uniref:TetR/AcrR family transcriptional regulator n=1 Tax=Shimia TaxID=573139 RepID=UPI001FB34468|nr:MULTISPECIES: TetR/AcrR family transcriptional regulator [Shimia]MDV4143300.1 TetR/AcrR family transcriptional regulator [Shimia sp. FJ5]
MTVQKPEIRKGRKFDQVLDGARDVFLRDGFEGASVDDIARAASVSKATLYSYFPDKSALFMEMARLEMAGQAERMASCLDFNAPPETVLPQVGRGMMSFMLTEFGRRVFRIAVAESDRFPELGRKFYETGPAFLHEGLKCYLKEAAARGEVRIEDFDLAASQFPELCKADLFPRLVFGMDEDFGEAEIERVLTGAVEMFMARYGAER